MNQDGNSLTAIIIVIVKCITIVRFQILISLKKIETACSFAASKNCLKCTRYDLLINHFRFVKILDTDIKNVLLPWN